MGSNMVGYSLFSVKVLLRLSFLYECERPLSAIVRIVAPYDLPFKNERNKETDNYDNLLNKHIVQTQLFLITRTGFTVQAVRVWSLSLALSPP